MKQPSRYNQWCLGRSSDREMQTRYMPACIHVCPGIYIPEHQASVANPDGQAGDLAVGDNRELGGNQIIPC